MVGSTGEGSKFSYLGRLKGHEPNELNTTLRVRYPRVKGQESYGCEVRETEPREAEARAHREAKGLEVPGLSVRNPRRSISEIGTWASLGSHDAAYHTQYYLAQCLVYNTRLRTISCYDVTIVIITPDSKELRRKL